MKGLMKRFNGDFFLIRRMYVRIVCECDKIKDENYMKSFVRVYMKGGDMRRKFK